MRIVLLPSKARRALLPVALFSVALITPAFANSFHTLGAGSHFHVGGRPSPGPDEVRASRFYPPESMVQGHQGKVGLKVFLTSEGTARDAVIESSSGFPRLDEAAVRYVKDQYDYDPDPGEQMPEFVRTVVNFQLK